MDVLELREALGIEALRGYNTSCPQPPSSVVRVFIISTMSDLTSERNAFWEKAYPELQGFCQNLGLVLEVVDFRWGMSDSIITDHVMTELCLKEIKLCQKVSTSLSCLAFVGTQYGARPLPHFISEREFDVLQSKLSKDQEGLTLVKKWFIRDDNSVPVNYTLQPISLHYPNYDNTTPETRAQHDEDVFSWKITEARLLQLLCGAASQAERDGDMSSEQKCKFFKSMTEWELEEGFLRCLQDQNEPLAVIFMKELANLKKTEYNKHASKFFDTTADGLLDTEAQELLSNLKQRINNACLGKLQIQSLELNNAAIDVNRKEHRNYLERFCEQVTSQIKSKINKPASPIVPGSLWLQQELFHHGNLSSQRCSVFTGMDGLLAKLCLVLWESTNFYHPPLIVHGPPETGKTSLLCKLAQQMRAVLDPHAVVALRLLGTSPFSTDVDSVLRGICFQICGAFGLVPPCPQTAKSQEMLVRFFHAMLQEVSKQGETLVLILDSLDHLSLTNNAHTWQWIPKEIPPNVHLIVSALNQGSPLKKLNAMFKDETFFFEVGPLTFDQGQAIIDATMSAAGRRLTSEQVQVIHQSFNKTGSALHLKLMLDMAKQWPSYTSTSEFSLGSSVQDIISLFLQRLEIKHGKKLVCHALGYISVSRSGLSESELRDVLSLDNDVLAEVYHSWLPPSHTLLRFPPLLWARLKHDLGDYLTERWENGIVVLGFSLRNFTEMVKDRYLTAEKQVEMHVVLSEYFSGQWSQGQLKPIHLPLLKTQLKADRKVPCQPMWFTEGFANLRMLNELPYHLIHANKWEELCTALIGNLKWLCCKTLSCGVASVIQDLSLCFDIMDCPEIQLIRDCFLLLKPTIDFIDGHIDPSLLFTELCARLQALASDYPALIGRLCSDCHEWFASFPDPILVPRCTFLQSPGGPLESTLSSFVKGFTAIDVCAKNDLLIAGSVEGVLLLWDLKHLEVLHILVGHTGAIQSVKLVLEGDHCLSTGLDGTLRKWSLQTGQQIYCIPGAVSVQPWPAEQILVLESSAMVVSNAQGQVGHLFLMSSGCDRLATHAGNFLPCTPCFVVKLDSKGDPNQVQVKSWHLDTGELLYEADVNEECSILGVLGEDLAVLSSDGQLWLYDLSTGRQKSHCQLGSEQGFTLSSILRLPRHKGLLVACQERSLLLISATGTVTDVELPAPALFMCSSEDETMLFAGCERTLAVLQVNPATVQKSQELLHEATVLSAASYNNGNKVITGSQDQVIRLWGLINGQLLDCFSGVGSPVTFLSVYNSLIISASTTSDCLKIWQPYYNPKHKSQPCIPANCPRVVTCKDGNTVHFIREEDRTKVYTWSFSEGLSSDVMDVSSEVCCMELAQQKRLLFCGLIKGTVLIYPLAFAQETLCLLPPESLHAVRSMAISSREDRMVVAYEDEVCLFEITARDSFPCVEGPSHRYSLSLLHSPVSAMALLPDCRLLYGTLGGEVAIYDFRSASAAELDHHASAITCIAMSNWDTHAMVGSADCVQKLWSLKPMMLDHTMEYKGFYFEGVLCAVFSVNDKYVFTGSQDKTIKVWDVSTGLLLYIQYVYAAVIRITPYKDGFVAVTQNGSFMKEGFNCPYTLPSDYNPLRNFRAHYRVTSREKSLDPSHTLLKDIHSYNPLQFNLMGLTRTKKSNTCVLL